MRFKKGFTWIAVLLLMTVGFSVAFLNPVTAEEEWEPDNDEVLYLQDGRTEPYYYNYTDVVVEEAVDIPYPDVGNWFSYDTETTLDVLATTVDGGGEYTRVFLHVSAAGGYSYNETESVEHPHDDLSPPGMGHIGNAGQVIEAEVADYEGDHIPYLDIERSKNSGTTNITDGDEGGYGETSDTQKLALQGCLFAAQMGAVAVDVKTFGALSAVSFAATLATRGSDDEPDPFPENKDCDSGEDANVRQVWKHDPEMSEWDDNAGRMENPLEGVHGTSTILYLSLDNDYLHDSATLEISAYNLLGISPYGDDEYYESSITEGAEATVEIPIKNAEPELDDDNKMETDKNSYEASDYSSSVYPDLEGLIVENPAECTDVDYEVEIEWDGEWDYDTHTAYTWITHGEEIDKTLNIGGIPEDDKWYEVEITYSIKALDRYGGWEEDPGHTIEIEVKNDEDKDSGAPTPPPGGPIPTSTEYRFSLERSEYEEYLEEGSIAPELLESLEEEGIDDLGKEAELSPAEEGWLIQQDSEKRYWIEVTEKELRVCEI